MKTSTTAKIMLLLFVASIFLMLSGCSRRIVPTTIITDSTITSATTAQRDTVITIGADSASAELSLELPSGLHHDPGAASALPNKSITVRGSHSVVTIQQKGQKVQATCLCPELEVKARLYDQIIKSTRKRTETITKIVREKFIPIFTLYTSYFGIACLVALLIYVGVKTFKFIKFI